MSLGCRIASICINVNYMVRYEKYDCGSMHAWIIAACVIAIVVIMLLHYDYLRRKVENIIQLLMAHKHYKRNYDRPDDLNIGQIHVGFNYPLTLLNILCTSLLLVPYAIKFLLSELHSVRLSGWLDKFKGEPLKKAMIWAEQ